MAKNIRLNFFGASLEGLDDFSISDEIKVVLAGPFFNFLIVVFCYLSFWFFPESYHFLNQILLVNWSIFLFNMLPIFPLDFGRILLLLLSKKHQRTDALKIVKRISLIFVFILFILGLILLFFHYNYLLVISSINLMILNFSNVKNTSYKRTVFIRRKFELINRGLMERTIYINIKTDHLKLLKFIDDYHFVNFIFLDDNMVYVYEKNELELYKELGFI